MSTLQEINIYTDEPIYMPIDGFLIMVQYVENYGARWKFKFGSTYVYECDNTADNIIALHKELSENLINNPQAKEYVTYLTYIPKQTLIDEIVS